MKIIAAIDLMDGKVVRLSKGDPLTKKIYSDNPYQVAQMWENQGADMIQFVDLDAALGLGSNLLTIKNTIKKLHTPTLIAGGLRNEQLINDALSISSYIILGTIPFTNKKLLSKFIHNKNQIIISVDQVSNNIVIEGWKKNTTIKLIDGVKNFISLGFSNFLLTNVEKDGMLQGIEIHAFSEICKIDSINVFAAGGISNTTDIMNLKKIHVYAVVLGKSLYEGILDISSVKKI